MLLSHEDVTLFRYLSSGDESCNILPNYLTSIQYLKIPIQISSNTKFKTCPGLFYFSIIGMTLKSQYNDTALHKEFNG